MRPVVVVDHNQGRRLGATRVIAQQVLGVVQGPPGEPSRSGHLGGSHRARGRTAQVHGFEVGDRLPESSRISGGPAPQRKVILSPVVVRGSLAVAGQFAGLGAGGAGAPEDIRRCHADRLPDRGGAPSRMKAMRQVRSVRLDHEWLVPRWITTSPGRSRASSLSVSNQISPSSTIA